MAKLALSESAEAGDEILRTILPDEQRTWLCPHCELEVQLTKDRVIDCIIDHPTIIVRKTHYWRCSVCNAVAGQESLRRAEAIEYISSST